MRYGIKFIAWGNECQWTATFATREEAELERWFVLGQFPATKVEDVWIIEIPSK